MPQVLISELIESLQKTMQERGDGPLQMRKFLSNDLEDCPELPYVIGMTPDGEYQGVIVKLT